MDADGGVAKMCDLEDTDAKCSWNLEVKPVGRRLLATDDAGPGAGGSGASGGGRGGDSGPPC